MIYRREILQGHECPEEYEDNLLELLIRINKVRDAWGKPMIVSSGLRSREDQIRIYAERGVIDPEKIPWHSKHFSCQAVDISDPDRSLMNWCLQNEALLAEIGLWMEVPDGQKRVHFQIVPPFSGKRFFIP